LSFPTPIPGLVIRYAYLWSADAEAGHEEGVKDRPCAVIMVTRTTKDRIRAYVLPVTHSPPGDPMLAVEIPQSTKARLGLDSERSWVVLSEANEFLWSGPDLRRAISGKEESIVYGMLPRGLTAKIRELLVAALRQHRTLW
jgi:hypothetical protein